MPEEEKRQDPGCTPEFCVRPAVKNIDEMMNEAQKIIPAIEDDHTSLAEKKEA